MCLALPIHTDGTTTSRHQVVNCSQANSKSSADPISAASTMGACLCSNKWRRLAHRASPAHCQSCLYCTLHDTVTHVTRVLGIGVDVVQDKKKAKADFLKLCERLQPEFSDVMAAWTDQNNERETLSEMKWKELKTSPVNNWVVLTRRPDNVMHEWTYSKYMWASGLPMLTLADSLDVLCRCSCEHFMQRAICTHGLALCLSAKETSIQISLPQDLVGQISGTIGQKRNKGRPGSCKPCLERY